MTASNDFGAAGQDVEEHGALQACGGGTKVAYPVQSKDAAETAPIMLYL